MRGGNEDGTLTIRLFGAFSMARDDGREIDVRSVKLRAMLAMLATAPEGRRTRGWLQDNLWSRSGHEHGRASLRRALADLRRLLGADFDRHFAVTNGEVRMRPDTVRVIGTPADGAFLEGIDIAEDGFAAWLQEQRTHGGPSGVPALPAATADTPAAGLRRAEGSLHPSLAVLPLAAARGADGAGPLGDMLAEELTRVLSRSHLLDVISHLSCRSFDARRVALTELRASLDTDYVVCGSYRIDGERLVVNADFIDAHSGRIVWTRELSGNLRAFLNWDDTMLATLAGEIGRAVTDTSIELARAAPVDEVETHALMMSGVALMHRLSVSSFAKARTYLEEVVRRAPTNPNVYAWQAKWHVLSVVQGWSSNLEADARAASDLTARALDLQPDCSFSLSIDGFVHNNLMHELDTAMARYRTALEVNPNNALAWLLKGTLHAFRDEAETAMHDTTRARALSPLDPHKFFFDGLSAAAALSAGRYDTALELANASLRANRRHTSSLRARIVALQRLGLREEARAAAEELMRADPSLTVRGYLEKHPAAHYATGRDWADALRAAGIPG